MAKYLDYNGLVTLWSKIKSADTTTLNAAKSDTTSKINALNISSITSRIATNEGDIDTLQNDMTTAKSNITTLQSEETKITSPTVNIGTGTTTSLNIGNSTTAQVNLKGTGNLSITSDTSTSNVTAKTLKFEKNISSNDIKIRWDSTLNSLVFEKV